MFRISCFGFIPHSVFSRIVCSTCMTYTTNAIALKYFLFREYDRVYTLYSRDFGKIQCIARGANRIKSKLAAHLEPCVVSHCMVADGKRIDTLAQARTYEAFIQLRMDMARYCAAMVIIESVDTLIQGSEKDQRIFELMHNALRSINNVPLNEVHESSDTHNTAVSFLPFLYKYLLHLLIILGHAPHWQDQEALRPFIVASRGPRDIILTSAVQQCIDNYLARVLDGKRITSFELYKS